MAKRVTIGWSFLTDYITLFFPLLSRIRSRHAWAHAWAHAHAYAYPFLLLNLMKGGGAGARQLYYFKIGSSAHFRVRFEILYQKSETIFTMNDDLDCSSNHCNYRLPQPSIEP